MLPLLFRAVVNRSRNGWDTTSTRSPAKSRASGTQEYFMSRPHDDSTVLTRV